MDAMDYAVTVGIEYRMDRIFIWTEYSEGNSVSHFMSVMSWTVHR